MLNPRQYYVMCTVYSTEYVNIKYQSARGMSDKETVTDVLQSCLYVVDGGPGISHAA